MQKYLRHCPSFLLKWPVHDLVLVIPPSSPYQSCWQYKTILGGTTLNEREGKRRGGGGQSVLYITDVQLAAICSKERPVFHRIVSTFLQLVVASPHKKMKKMLCSLLRNPCNVNFNKKRVNRSFLTKPFWSRWLAIGFILFCSWTLTSLSPYNQAKKKTPRIQPS